jgi:hypothetical protein
MTHAHYNNAENLSSVMIEFGKYTLKYVPPGETPEDHSVSMTISSEANLSQMLEFFSSFLRAAGYEFDGKELCLEREAPDFSDVPDKWDTAEPNYWGGYPSGFVYKGAEGQRGK